MNKFSIKYFISKKFNCSYKGKVVDADEMDLRYNMFFGSISLVRGISTIQLNWDWIPILDFALGVLSIYTKLSMNERGEVEFDFTESDERLIFERLSETIKITTTFSNEALEMTFEEFEQGCIKFYKDALFNLINNNPELRYNKVFIEFLHKAEHI